MTVSPVYDFHMHTFLSDGVLLPIELIRRCIVNGYAGMAIADHTSASTMERVLAEVAPSGRSTGTSTTPASDGNGNCGSASRSRTTASGGSTSRSP